MDAFLAGLHDHIATRILEMFPGPQTLLAMQTIASRIDNRISTHRQFSNLQGQNSNNSNNNKIKRAKNHSFSKSNLNPNLMDLYLKKKKKEEEEKIFVYIVDPLNILSTIVHLKINTKINLHQIALMFLIPNQNPFLDLEFLTQIFLFTNFL